MSKKRREFEEGDLDTKFILMRKMYAWGYTAWQIVEIPRAHGYRTTAEYLNDMHGDHHSDKYRRIEWKPLKRLPTGYIQSRIKAHRCRIRNSKMEIARLQRIETVETEVTCRTCGRYPCGKIMKDSCKPKKERFNWVSFWGSSNCSKKRRCS